MITISEKGNINTDESFATIIYALKNNIMRNINVAELAIVKTVEADYCECVLLNNTAMKFTAIIANDVVVKQNDVVLAIFTKTSFKNNLTQYKNNKQLTTNIAKQSANLHLIQNAVIIAIIYKGGN